MSKAPTVLFETLWLDPADGWSIASRAYARAMEMAGIDVHLLSWLAWAGEPDPQVMAEVGHLATRPSKYDLYLFSTAFGGPQIMDRPLRSLIHCAGPKVLYTMIERLSVATESAALCGELNGVWVPCSANVESFVRSGVPRSKLGYMPYPFFNDDPHLGLAELTRRKGPPGLYWIGRWEPRKGPDNTVRAFMRAFRPGEARLTLKMGHVPFEDRSYVIGPEIVIVEEAQSGTNGWTSTNWQQHITILRGRLPAEDIVRLHAENDVYVSASRGEGIDLPAFRAKLSGNRVVATYSGGPDDFLGTRDIRVPASGTIQVHPGYARGPLAFESTAQYTDYRIEDLVTALRTAVEQPYEGKGRDWPIDNFRARTVGLKIRKMVERVI